MFTTQHHKVMVEIINDWLDSDIDEYNFDEKLINDFADYFTKDNPQFDKSKFLKACGITD